MNQQRDHRGRLRKILLLSAAGLALTASVGFVRWFGPAWQGTPYPLADPAVTARRLDGHTQSVYDALGLPRAELDAAGSRRGMETGVTLCYPRGLRHLNEQLADSPPAEPQVVNVSDEWLLRGVSRTQAGPALERARDGLTRQGWKVIAYQNSGDDLRLDLTPPGTDDTVSVTAYPGNRLQVGARSKRARYASDTPLNDRREPRLPAQQAPTQLRG